MPLKDSVGTVTFDVGVIADGKAVKRNGSVFEGFDAASATHTHALSDLTTGTMAVDLTLAVSKVVKVNGTQVVGAQGAAVADASGGGVIDAEARTALNALLARLRTHGLIAT